MGKLCCRIINVQAIQTRSLQRWMQTSKLLFLRGMVPDAAVKVEGTEEAIHHGHFRVEGECGKGKTVLGYQDFKNLVLKAWIHCTLLQIDLFKSLGQFGMRKSTSDLGVRKPPTMPLHSCFVLLLTIPFSESINVLT